jgi:hypothetical protein
LYASSFLIDVVADVLDLPWMIDNQSYPQLEFCRIKIIEHFGIEIPVSMICHSS